MTGARDPPNIRYRRLAQESLDKAFGTASLEARAALVERAQTWLRLAVDLEGLVGWSAKAENPAKKPEDEGG
jgi:hypothetical protein